MRAIDNGWFPGPRIFPAGHTISPTGGHLDPTVVRALAPNIMPLSVEDCIANGVPEVRKAVRDQIKHGVKLIKISASGGVMTHHTQPGAQPYSDEELAAICDEAHRAGIRVAAHAIGDDAVRGCLKAGVDCIEHGFLMSDDTIHLMVDREAFLVTTSYLAEGMAVNKQGDPIHKKEGRRGLSEGQGDAAQDHRRPQDRLRFRCSWDSARVKRQGTVGHGGPWHDPPAGRKGRHHGQRRFGQMDHSWARSKRDSSLTSSPCPATPLGTSHSARTSSSS
jgi:hypothetical protein